MGSSSYCREGKRQSIYCNPAMRLSMWSPAASASGRSWATRNWLKSRKRYDERLHGNSETRQAPSIPSSLITVLKTRLSPTCREFKWRLEYGLHGSWLLAEPTCQYQSRPSSGLVPVCRPFALNPRLQIRLETNVFPLQQSWDHDRKAFDRYQPPAWVGTRDT